MRSDFRDCHFGHGKFAKKYAPVLALGPVAALGSALYGEKHGGSEGPSAGNSAAQIRQRAALRMQATPRPSGD